MSDRNLGPLSELIVEGFAALLLGLFGGLGIGIGLWLLEMAGWSRGSAFNPGRDFHLLPEGIRTSWGWFGVWILACALIGATSGAFFHLKRRTTPWKPSWNKRGNPADRDRR
mgnify:CR=1 FL=1